MNVGGKHAIFNTVSAVVDDGDDVIIPTPYWVSFADIARYAGGRTVFAPDARGGRLPPDCRTSGEVAHVPRPGC